jgi:fumarylacetoacetase
VVVVAHAMTAVMPGWVPVATGSPFPVSNLPYGVFTTQDEPQRPRIGRIGIAVGDFVLDVGALAAAQCLPYAAALQAANLNPFMACGPATWDDFRTRLTAWLTDEAYRPLVEPLLVPLAAARLQMAFEVADYVDFYSSEHHATNAGRMLRPGQPPLHPNWKHLPVGYHGRSGTVRVSGTPVLRPRGQRIPAEGAPPVVGPSQRLDFEAEVGFVVGVGSELGRPLPVEEFASHVFGVCLVNDWSARDIQAWEYAPLGPLLGKSFLTSISPWVVPLAALEAARVTPPPRDPDVLGYLDDADYPWGLDIQLSVCLNGQQISQPPLREMYWTAAQQLAHLTVNGASVRTGDLFASGTVSGPEREQFGSLMELTWAGQHPLTLASGATRTFLEDGDEVVISATAPGADGELIGFGDVRGRVR